MVIALAGRRIDAPKSANPVFPEENIEAVRERIERLLKDRSATVLVSSAACGADLLALEAAGVLGVRRRVILPFDPLLFRETSVIDRPGNWGPVFDRVIADVEAKGDLVNLQLEPDSDSSYIQTNHVILSGSISLAAAAHCRAAAALVWDGVSRGDDDITDLFGNTARTQGLEVFEISTL